MYLGLKTLNMVYEGFVAIALHLLEIRQYSDNLVNNENFASGYCVKILNTKINIFYTPLVKPVDSGHPLPHHTQLHHEHQVPE
jgi:hypothetical protein